MNFKEIFIVISFWFQLIIVIECTTEQQCYDQIYRQCTHETTFTTKEIMTAQLYLQRRFSTTGPIRAACPISASNPPCIRKDIKCLSPGEIQRLTSAWLQLFANGTIAKFTKIHFDYWGAVHKFSPGGHWHLWFINQLEKELQKIDPSVCMPYWNSVLEYAHPEKSVVWDIFGHAGNASNDYCVPDGPFANINCTFPSEHCLRRQWRISPLLDPWKGPEYFTMVQQMLLNLEIFDFETFFSTVEANLQAINPASYENLLLTSGNLIKYSAIIANPQLTPYIQRMFLGVWFAHFDTHLSCGGYNGDMSVQFAPNDPLFHVFHIFFELADLYWQLCNFNDYYLVPKSFNGGISYDNVTKFLRFPDIDSDTFNYYDNVYIKEAYQFGYGEMCHLYDLIIKPINDMVNINLQFEAKYPFTSWLYSCVPPLSPPLPSLPTTATLPNRVRPLCNPPPLPTAAQRLKQALSPTLFAKYYPKFASNQWSFCDHVFLNISADCNPVSSVCKKMPFAQPFKATPEGLRQYQAFTAAVGDVDETWVLDGGEIFYQKFMNDLNNGSYCSPYV